MKPTNLRNRDNSAAVGLLNLSFYRRFASQGQMSTGVEIVVEIQSKNAHQVSLVEYDDVVQAFAAHGSNQALTIWILPW